jgi:hypothetical protein
MIEDFIEDQSNPLAPVLRLRRRQKPEGRRGE